MNTINNLVYAVYPNSTGFGYVYMENARKLIDYGSVRINPISNRKLLARIIKDLKYFRPTILILNDPEGISSRTGRRTKNLISKVLEFAKSENLTHVQYSRDQIRDVFKEFNATTKYEISQVLIQEFTELEPKRPKERKLWDSECRHMPIFEALSLAITWYYLKS